MRLQSGDKTIDFEVTDYKGKKIRLSDFTKKKVLLSFYRYASCPLCNLRIHGLIKRYNDYHAAGLEIFSFFESPVESMKKYVGTQEPPFALIPDPDRLVYKKYRVEKSLGKYITGLFSGKLGKAIRMGFKPGKMEGVKTLVPADFLIENGLIKTAFYGKDISDHIPFEVIEDFLKT